MDKEKFDIKSFSGINKNFSIIYKIIRLDLKNLFFDNKLNSIFKNTSAKKKWVRNQDNNTTSDKKISQKESTANIQTAYLPKVDIIKNDKNSKIDKQ